MDGSGWKKVNKLEERMGRNQKRRQAEWWERTQHYSFALCALYSLSFSCIIFPSDVRSTLFIFLHKVWKKLRRHSNLKPLPIGEENTLPKFANMSCFKNVKIKRFSNDPPTTNTLSETFHIRLLTRCILWYVQIKALHTTFLKLVLVTRKFMNSKLALLSCLLNIYTLQEQQ